MDSFDGEEGQGNTSGGGGVEHVVRQGDCAASLADEYGHFWQTIWNHPNNAELRRRRADPNVLYPGEVVFIPDKVLGHESGVTEQRHRFRRKGVPVMLRLRLLEGTWPDREQKAPADDSEPGQDQEESGSAADAGADQSQPEDEPRRHVPYVLLIDGRLFPGVTDDDGRLQCWIPPGAREGSLIVEPGTARELKIPLQLGHLNPAAEDSGVRQPLNNLGFDAGDENEATTGSLESALRSFQQMYGLTVTGEADQSTRDKLSQLFST